MREPRQLTFGWSFKREVNLGQLLSIAALCLTVGSIYVAKEKWCAVTDARLLTQETTVRETVAMVKSVSDTVQKVQLDQVRLAAILERRETKGN